jgi:hypothetical protein
MKRVAYIRYVTQGGDWGAPISGAMAHQAPAGLLGSGALGQRVDEGSSRW